MESRDRARKAKAHLLSQLGNVDWLRGVGLTSTDGELALKVNVKELTPAVRAAIPRSIDGVQVVVAQVGRISALNRE